MFILFVENNKIIYNIFGVNNVPINTTEKSSGINKITSICYKLTPNQISSLQEEMVKNYYIKDLNFVFLLFSEFCEIINPDLIFSFNNGNEFNIKFEFPKYVELFLFNHSNIKCKNIEENIFKKFNSIILENADLTSKNLLIKRLISIYFDSFFRFRYHGIPEENEGRDCKELLRFLPLLADNYIIFLKQKNI